MSVTKKLSDKGEICEAFFQLSSETRDVMSKKLCISPGTFYDCVIPEDVESLWGPIPLERLPKGVDNNCRAVTHE